MDKIKAIVESKKGRLLSGAYKNEQSVFEIQCEHGHIWKTKYINVRKKHWCPTCGRIITADVKDKIAATVKNNYSQLTEEMIKQRIDKRKATMEEQKKELCATLTHKTCRQCNINKAIDEFSKRTDAKDGLHSYCKSCTHNNKNNSTVEQVD